jgi:salicylate hydroxylase
MGGLAAAIAIARTGAQVTLLEAARELGEIGAGIQVFANVSRLLVRWGVDELIGKDLIAVDEINTWDADNQLIARFDPKLGAKQTGFPHWYASDSVDLGLDPYTNSRCQARSERPSPCRPDRKCAPARR